MNMLENGINLPKTIHNNWSTAHSTYNQNFSVWLNSVPASTPADAASILINKLDDIKLQFQNGAKLDEIIF